jgi:hypothetical protein
VTDEAAVFMQGKYTSGYNNDLPHPSMAPKHLVSWYPGIPSITKFQFRFQSLDVRSMARAGGRKKNFLGRHGMSCKNATQKIDVERQLVGLKRRFDSEE